MQNHHENRKPENIVNELLDARKRYHFKKYRFVDAFLNNDEDWIVELCTQIQNSELKGIAREAYRIRSDHLSERVCMAIH